MSDINVDVGASQPIDVNFSDSETISILESTQDINVSVTEETINIDVADAQPIDVSIDDFNISQFLELTDTPISYSGQAGKILKVNVAENALEFDSASGDSIWGQITGTLSDQTDLQTELDLKFDSADFNTSFDTQLATKDTDDLSEGSTNLYDKTVAFTGGTNVTIGGTYPNFSVTDNSASSSDLTSHTGDLTIHFTESSIDHTLIQNIGTNTHTQIDTHISNTSNPHSVLATQISDFDTEVSNNTDVSANTTHRGTTTGNPHNVTLSDVGGTTDHTALSNIGTNTHVQIDSHIANVTTNPHAVDKTDVGLSNVLNTEQVPTSEKGTSNGVATLDGGGKIPSTQLPSTVMEYLGTWNASTNTPTLIDGTGDNGDVYLVSVAGTQDLGSGNITFAVGDWIVYSGAIWEKSLNSDSVVSVNSQTGVVVLDTGDIAEVTDKNYVTDAEAVVIGNTSGTNTGDQSAGDFAHNSLSSLNTGDYIHLTAANHTDLTDAGDSALHYHSTDRARANHTGTQTASTISDFDTEVANNSAVTANTAKQTNVSTDLSEGTSTETTVDVNSSDGTNATLVSASISRAGLLTKAKFDEITANTAKVSNVTTNLSAGTRTATTIDVDSSDGTNATLVEADTTNAGILGSDKWDEIVANSLKVTNQTHTGDVTGSIALAIATNAVNDTHIDFGTGTNQVNTADIPELTNLYYTDARVNSNGSVALNTTHRIGDGSDHADVATNTTNIITLSGVVVSVSGAGATHEADSTNPHGTTLTQTNISSTGTISGTTLSMTVGDHGNASGAQVINAVYDTGSTPPTASTTTEGTLFIQYVA